MLCAAEKPSNSSDSVSDEAEDEDSWENQITCAPAFVMVDQSNPHYSAFNIDVRTQEQGGGRVVGEGWGRRGVR